MYGLSSHMNLLIASSQSIVRSTLLTLLSNQPDMTVIGQAKSVTDLLVLARAIQIDLVLVEGSLLGRSAAETIQALHCLAFPPKVLVYDWQTDRSQVVLDAGADAFFWEGEDPKALLTMTRKLWLEAAIA